MSNVLKTGLLLGVLTALLVLAGQAIAGERGMIIAFVFAAIMNFVSYWFSDKIVLAMYGAQPVDETQAPRLHAIVRRLASVSDAVVENLRPGAANELHLGWDDLHQINPVSGTPGVVRIERPISAMPATTWATVLPSSLSISSDRVGTWEICGNRLSAFW